MAAVRGNSRTPRRALLRAAIGLVAILVWMPSCVDGEQRVSSGDHSTKAGNELLEGGAFTNFAATDQYLIGFSAGSADVAVPQPRYAVSPLVGGEAREFAIPVGAGRAFSPTLIVGADDEAIIMGRECAIDSPPADLEAGFCPQGSFSAFSIDPDSLTVDQLRVDEGLASLPGLAPSVAQRTREGWVVFSYRVLDNSEGPLRQTVVADVVGLDAKIRHSWDGEGEACVADGAAYQLTKSLPSSESGISLDTPAELALVRHDSRGAARPLELPSVNSAFGGAAVHLGCSPKAPFLVTADPVPGEPNPRVYEFTEGSGWKERPELIPPDAVLPEQPISDVYGIAMPWSIGAPANGLTSTMTYARDGTIRLLSENPGEFWKGRSGVRLAVSQEDEVTHERPEEDLPGLRAIEVWQ